MNCRVFFLCCCWIGLSYGQNVDESAIWQRLDSLAVQVEQVGVSKIDANTKSYQEIFSWLQSRGYHTADGLREAFNEGDITLRQMRQIIEVLSVDIVAHLNPMREATLEQVNQFTALSLQHGWLYHYAYFGNLRMILLYEAYRTDDMMRLYKNQRDLLEGLYRQNPNEENALALLYTLSIYLYLGLAEPPEVNAYRQQMDRLLAQVDHFPLWPDLQTTYYIALHSLEMRAENYGRAKAMLDSALAYSTQDHFLSRFEAAYYLQRGDYSRVEAILDTIIPRFEADTAENLVFLYRTAYLNAEAQGKWKEALSYYKAYCHKLCSEDKTGMYAMQRKRAVLYELEATQQALQQARLEKERRKFWIAVLLGSFILILILLVFLHFWRMNKLKIKKIEEQKVNIMESNNLKYVSDIKLIESKWSDLYQSGREAELPKELRDKLKNMNNTLKGVIDDIALLGNQGRDFSTTDFVSRLRNLNSRINDNEARIAIAVRVSSNDQEASEKLGMSLAAYRKAKSRLKKKLFPEATERIADLLQRI